MKILQNGIEGVEPLGVIIKEDSNSFGDYYDYYRRVYFRPRNGVVIDNISMQYNNGTTIDLLNNGSNYPTNFFDEKGRNGYIVIGTEYKVKSDGQEDNVVVDIIGEANYCDDLIKWFNYPDDQEELIYFKTNQTLKDSTSIQMSWFYIKTKNPHIYTNPILFDGEYKEEGSDIPDNMFRPDNWMVRQTMGNAVYQQQINWKSTNTDEVIYDMRSSPFTKPIYEFFMTFITKKDDPEVKSILLYVDKCFAIFRSNLYWERDSEMGLNGTRRVNCPTIQHTKQGDMLNETYTPSIFLLSKKDQNTNNGKRSILFSDEHQYDGSKKAGLTKGYVTEDDGTIPTAHRWVELCGMDGYYNRDQENNWIYTKKSDASKTISNIPLFSDDERISRYYNIVRLIDIPSELSQLDLSGDDEIHTYADAVAEHMRYTGYWFVRSKTYDDEDSDADVVNDAVLRKTDAFPHMEGSNILLYPIMKPYAEVELRIQKPGINFINLYSIFSKMISSIFGEPDGVAGTTALKWKSGDISEIPTNRYRKLFALDTSNEREYNAKLIKRYYKTNSPFRNEFFTCDCNKDDSGQSYIIVSNRFAYGKGWLDDVHAWCEYWSPNQTLKYGGFCEAAYGEWFASAYENIVDKFMFVASTSSEFPAVFSKAMTLPALIVGKFAEGANTTYQSVSDNFTNVMKKSWDVTTGAIGKYLKSGWDSISGLFSENESQRDEVNDVKNGKIDFEKIAKGGFMEKVLNNVFGIFDFSKRESESGLMDQLTSSLKSLGTSLQNFLGDMFNTAQKALILKNVVTQPLSICQGLFKNGTAKIMQNPDVDENQHLTSDDDLEEIRNASAQTNN